MKREIERKFLVKDDGWKHSAGGVVCRQGYLSRTQDCVVRVRIADDKAYLSVKGAVTAVTRTEFEYEIPFSDAEVLLSDFCENPLIQKIRHVVFYKGFIWEVDEFSGENQGLVIAELELESEDQVFEKPDWVGAEVTGDPKYYNANLVKNPYNQWTGKG
ncbi:MAG: adenylate cyclase [Desulfobacterales bacterium CG23_combo_of_CG06-09_8_20_14_all_52_9]|nr:MAG: adenylate cyclase [Desulfobacterales bacterium CG23_combo_of_CG06-09_8_20_14_all_52_9]